VCAKIIWSHLNFVTGWLAVSVVGLLIHSGFFYDRLFVGVFSHLFSDWFIYLLFDWLSRYLMSTGADGTVCFWKWNEKDLSFE